MALIKNGFYKGKIGNVSFFERLGQQYACVLKKASKKPASKLQKKSRIKFQFIARFGSLNKINLVRPYWHTVAIKNERIGYNYFIQSNLIRYGTMDDPHAFLLLVPENGIAEPEFSVDKKDGYLKLQWECPDYINEVRHNDQLYILGISEDYTLCIHDNLALRKDQICNYPLPTKEHHLYAFWKSNEKWSISKLIYQCPF